MPPRLRDVWLWTITVLDDVLIEKLWHRLRAGDARGAARAIWEVVIGFPGCWLGVLVFVALIILLVRAL